MRESTTTHEVCLPTAPVREEPLVEIRAPDLLALVGLDAFMAWAEEDGFFGFQRSIESVRRIVGDGAHRTHPPAVLHR